MTQTAIQTATEQLRIDGISESERHRLLKSERRRVVLAVLDEQAAVIERQCLAAKVAAHETGADSPSEEAVDRVEVSLHHAHLPLMDDLGVLNYHPDSDTVALR